MPYATLAQYKVYDPTDENTDAVITKRLTDASVEVDGLTIRSVYNTNSDGTPSDTVVVNAFRDATMSIVSYWADTDDPDGSAITEGAVKIGSVSLGTTSSSQENLTDQQRTARRIGERAFTILRIAGLLQSSTAHT